MSTPVPSSPVATRPRVVTAAVVSLYIYALVAGLPPIFFLIFGPDLASVLARGAPAFGGYVSRKESALVAGVTIALSLAIMLGFGVLGRRIARGVPSARTATWVIGGLLTAFNIGGVESVMDRLFPGDTAPAGTSAEELGVHTWDLATTVVELVSLLAALILLSLRTTSNYFRRMDVWVPPIGYQGPAPVALTDTLPATLDRIDASPARPDVSRDIAVTPDKR
jgi:hypothetical protein